MDRKAELIKILGSQTNDKAVHAQAIWNVVKDAESREEKVDLLEYVLTDIFKVPKHPLVLSNKGLDSARWADCSKKLGKIVKDQVRNAFFATSNSKQFATELLRILDFYCDPDDLTFTLGTALYSCDVIPYHNLPGDPVQLSNDELTQLIAANKDRAELIKYLVSLPFFDWTQAVSQVLQVIDDVEDRKVRIALLTLYMIRKKEEWTKE